MNNDEIKINSEEIKEQNKKEKIKNAFIIKKGTYSAAITAIVLAAIIILNILVFSLSSKVTLEFDTTSEKVNSISKENKNYLKGINEDIEIIVCGKKDEYATTMNNYAQGIYGVTVENPEYFDQTVSLLEKYPLQNGKIDLKFMDTNSTEFTKISQAYADLGLAYGDIIVRQAKENGRVKKVTFEDVKCFYAGLISNANLNIKSAKDSIKQAQIALEYARKSAKQDINNKVAEMKRIYESLEVIKLNSQIATRAYNLAKDSYAAGLVSQTELESQRQNRVSAQQSLMQGEINYITSLHALANALNISYESLIVQYGVKK